MRARCYTRWHVIAGFLVCSLGQPNCDHELYKIDPPEQGAQDESGRQFRKLEDGVYLHENSIKLNHSRLYYYENLNMTTMNQEKRHRKLIIQLAPCRGVVYLLVRKTRRCWPNPHECCYEESPTTPKRYPVPCRREDKTDCTWTHFHSTVDGTADGAPTFFEIPLTSTKFFLTVYAPAVPNLEAGIDRPSYTLLVLADIGAYPRPGSLGRLSVEQVGHDSVNVQWSDAVFVPTGVSSISHFNLFSSLMLETDKRTNDVVLLTPDKIMNTVCGLERNSVIYAAADHESACRNGRCNMTVRGMIPKKRYLLNVVAVSHRKLNAAYIGMIMTTEWRETRTFWDEKILNLIGAVSGTIIGVVLIGYLWIVKLYN